MNDKIRRMKSSEEGGRGGSVDGRKEKARKGRDVGRRAGSGRTLARYWGINYTSSTTFVNLVCACSLT